MRCWLRFLQSDMLVAVRLPVDSDVHGVMFQTEFFKDEAHLLCYSNASHAPLRATKRRGISGGVLTVCGCTIHTLSRHITTPTDNLVIFHGKWIVCTPNSYARNVFFGKVCARVLTNIFPRWKHILVLYLLRAWKFCISGASETLEDGEKPPQYGAHQRAGTVTLFISVFFVFFGDWKVWREVCDKQ